jgi:hypothetical protein
MTTALRKTDRIAQVLRNAIRITTPFHLTTCDDEAAALSTALG